ncbi:conserved Plasmodium protein, unknown function [Plasmodium gallinaceum]|uniref:Uncharacterized protein n=1 Tax=Plasmodium gallinaceum TaxID=5849 RepID=A0A1J1H2D9_PLAGA|nr:conserved Plasmodium protein, unknown function [Plasmodium gallinaceum]CRG97667.1 conserved Plasmodium protein, unknown function [Plasmodium gallinaceum]
MITKKFHKIRKGYLNCYRNISNNGKISYKDKNLNLCVSFNNNANVNHERFDNKFYLYNINSTIFKLFKYIHIFRKKYKKDTDLNNKMKDKYKIEQIFMCYISIYKNINRNLFLKLTLEILKFSILNKKIINDNEFYEELLKEVIGCRKEKELEKTIFYEYLIKILSILLMNSNFFNENFHRIFFIEALEMMKKEENINSFMKNFTYILSCISFYNRILKKELYGNTSVLLNIPSNNQIFLNQLKKNTLVNSLSIILDIFDRIQNYNYFNEVDICNIFDFLNEFKKTHNIKTIIYKNIHKYFTTLSQMKNLCLFLYLISTCTNAIHQNIYIYIYNIIFLKRKELTDLKNINLFLLSIIKYKNEKSNLDINKIKRNNLIKKRNLKKIKNINKKFELCLKLKHGYIKKRKRNDEKVIYFFIKHQFIQLIKKKKMSAKHVKTFYQYFLFYHIKKNFTRKKNYVSPINIINNYR